MDQIAALAELAGRYTGAELGRRLRTALASELEEIEDSELAALAQSLVERLQGQEGGPVSSPEPYYSGVQEFVESWLLPIYRRSIRGHTRTWCPCWWQHREAVSRLDALWRAWEVLRLDAGTGLSVWWRDHADHHLTILLDADGPFKGCEDGHSDRPLEPLPYQQPPGIFQRDTTGLPAEPIAASTRDTSRAPATAPGAAIATGRASNGRGPR
jgi:hypothetical protein